MSEGSSPNNQTVLTHPRIFRQGEGYPWLLDALHQQQEGGSSHGARGEEEEASYETAEERRRQQHLRQQWFHQAWNGRCRFGGFGGGGILRSIYHHTPHRGPSFQLISFFVACLVCDGNVCMKIKHIQEVVARLEREAHARSLKVRDERVVPPPLLVCIGGICVMCALVPPHDQLASACSPHFPNNTNTHHQHQQQEEVQSRAWLGCCALAFALLLLSLSLSINPQPIPTPHPPPSSIAPPTAAASNSLVPTRVCEVLGDGWLARFGVDGSEGGKQKEEGKRVWEESEPPEQPSVRPDGEKKRRRKRRPAVGEGPMPPLNA